MRFREPCWPATDGRHACNTPERYWRASRCWQQPCWQVRRPPQTASEGLSPTLARIKQTHTVRLGYRESSPPFSFLDHSNRPIGYSLELCEAIVEEIGIEVDDANLRIDYVKVTSDDRIPAVVQNKIDLECGSTTANSERARQVAFSPLMFVAGTKLMVAKTSSDLGAQRT